MGDGPVHRHRELKCLVRAERPVKMAYREHRVNVVSCLDCMEWLFVCFEVAVRSFLVIKENQAPCRTSRGSLRIGLSWDRRSGI